MNIRESAGAVVLNPLGEVVVVSQHGDSWSLPKGGIDEGEDAETAARREVIEETGLIDFDVVRELGSYERYRIGKGGVGEDTTQLKRIRMFLFRAAGGDLRPVDPENPEARWVAKDDVAKHLTHAKDREFFEGIKDSLD